MYGLQFTSICIVWHIFDVRCSDPRSSIPDSPPGSAFRISMQDITQFANHSGVKWLGKLVDFFHERVEVRAFVFRNEMVEVVSNYWKIFGTKFYKVDLTTRSSLPSINWFVAFGTDVHSWFTGHRSNSMGICIQHGQWKSKLASHQYWCLEITQKKHHRLLYIWRKASQQIGSKHLMFWYLRWPVWGPDAGCWL